MTTRVATCSCGQLKATTTGEPIRTGICHCHACQKRTGSVFGVTGRWLKERVTVEGSSSTWSRKGDEGPGATFHFCPTCGATVYWFNEAMPDNIAIAVGCFADASLPRPAISVYEERKHPWVVVPVDIEHWD